MWGDREQAGTNPLRTHRLSSLEVLRTGRILPVIVRMATCVIIRMGFNSRIVDRNPIFCATAVAHEVKRQTAHVWRTWIREVRVEIDVVQSLLEVKYFDTIYGANQLCSLE